ncbi:hypothetical protein EDD17DRAFT_1522246 [Pisolithus thermaeus]|nr:hypothetical protein EDD17DRAFT_1522246 [Pisolithus thermaeus]
MFASQAAFTLSTVLWIAGLNFRIVVELNEGAMDLRCLRCDSPSDQNSPFPIVRDMCSLAPVVPTYDQVSLERRYAAAFGSQRMILFRPKIIGTSYATPYCLDHSSKIVPVSDDEKKSLPTPNNRLVLFGPLSLVVLNLFRNAWITIRSAHNAASPVATSTGDAERTRA